MSYHKKPKHPSQPHLLVTAKMDNKYSSKTVFATGKITKLSYSAQATIPALTGDLEYYYIDTIVVDQPDATPAEVERFKAAADPLAAIEEWKEKKIRDTLNREAEKQKKPITEMMGLHNPDAEIEAAAPSEKEAAKKRRDNKINTCGTSYAIAFLEKHYWPFIRKAARDRKYYVRVNINKSNPYFPEGKEIIVSLVSCVSWSFQFKHAGYIFSFISSIDDNTPFVNRCKGSVIVYETVTDPVTNKTRVSPVNPKNFYTGDAEFTVQEVNRTIGGK